MPPPTLKGLESPESVHLSVSEYTKIKTTQENHEQRIQALERKADNDIDTMRMNARTMKGTIYGVIAAGLLAIVSWLVNKSMGT